MLIGRSVESGALEQLLEDARGGRSRALVLRGEPGVGKSALLEHARELAGDVLVLRATGIESESELAFAALHEVVRPLLDRATRLPEPQAAALAGAFGFETVPGADRFLISIAVLGLLADAAEERPVLCIVDDAHWVDQPSIEAIVFAARRLEAERVAILLAARAVGDRLSTSGLPELTIGGLADDDARMLLAQRVGPGLVPAVAERLIRATEGNALALVEVAATLTAEQVDGRRPLPDPLPLGPQLERAFLFRVRALPEPTQQALLVAAADDACEIGAVARAARSLGLPSAALDPAERTELVKVVGDTIQFRHPLVRSAVYRAATFAERQAVHAALAEAYGDADADRRAWHRAAAALEYDDEVAEDLEGSASRAWSRSGYAAASTALERAAALTRDDAERCRRLIDAAQGAWLGGDSQRARSLLTAAERTRVSDGAPRIAALRGWIEIRSGNPADGFDTLVEAARTADCAPEMTVVLLRGATEAVMNSGDARRAVLVGDLAEELAQRAELGDDDRAVVEFMIGHGKLMTGDIEAAVPYMVDTVAATRHSDDIEMLMHGALAALALGDDEVGCEIHYRAVQRARATGAVAALPITLARLTWSEWRLSRFGDAYIHGSEALRLALEMDQEPGSQYVVLALAEAALGRAGDCREHAEAARRVAVGRQIGMLVANSSWALGLLELGLGHPGEACAWFEPVTTVDPAASAQPVTALQMTPDAIEAAVRAGRVEQAQTLLARYEVWAHAAGLSWANALVARSRGLLSEGAAARTHFEEALALHAATGRPFETARTELAYGEMLRRDRQRLEARDHLRASAATFGRIGASAWEERAQAELRATGETVRRRDPSTLGDLTPQELQIARLVATGARNREIAMQLFLSPRTVDYHLRKVFMKLAITSRAELARMELGVEEAATAA